jgi:hypothetical protein
VGDFSNTVLKAAADPFAHPLKEQSGAIVDAAPSVVVVKKQSNSAVSALMALMNQRST